MYTITLEVNQICNLRCTYCYLGRKTNQKMSEQIAYKGLEIAFLNVERHRDRRLWVDFVGGEALLSFPFLKQLVEYIEGQALKRNILVTYSITTNGTILNDEILAWLIRYKIHLKVSIDGAEETHNRNRKWVDGGGSYANIIDNCIVANALKILSNDQGNSAFNGELNSSILMEATDWPDKLGNETDAGTFAGHFYDPDSGKNWLGQTSPTARTRAESYFQEAVNAYRAGDVQLAMSNLGKGTHYVSDLNEPHHASNLTAVNSNHSAFEKYVDKNRKSYTIAGNSFNSSVYTTALNTSTGDLMYSAAKHAKGLAANAQNESTYDSAGRRSVQHAIQTVTQYMYKFGKEVGIY